MDNQTKKSATVYAITSNKVLSLKNILRQVEYELPFKKLLPQSDYIEYLQTTYFFIDQNIDTTIDYVERNSISNMRFENLKNILSELIPIQTDLNNELIALGSSRNIELEKFYKEVRDDQMDDDLSSRPNYRQLDQIKNHILQIRELLSYQAKTPKQDFKKIWFEVGLLFATGEMDILIKKHNRNATKIAEELQKTSYNKYILASMNDYKESNSDKNIYFNWKKMQKIVDYCTMNNIIVTHEFKKRLEETKQNLK